MSPGPPLVSRPTLAYFAACSAGLILGAARTYYDLLDLGVPFRILGELDAARATLSLGATAPIPSSSSSSFRPASSAPAANLTAQRAQHAQHALQLPQGAVFFGRGAWLGVASDARLIMSRMLQSELGLFVALNWLVSVYCIAAVLTTVS